MSGNTDLYVVRPDGTGLVQLTNHPDSAAAPSWSPDGQRIAFRSTSASGSATIWTAHPDGGDVRRVVDIPAPPYLNSGPEWSPRGDLLLFSGPVPNTVPARIWSVAPDGTGLQGLTAGTWSWRPVWSPDGSRFAYEYAVPYDGWQVIVANADGSGAHVVAASDQGNLAPAWSPDGRQLAFVKYRGDGSYGVFTVGADGSDERLVSSGFFAGFDPHWSPDGRVLLFAGTSGYLLGIIAIDADGSDPQILPLASGSHDRPVVRPR